MKHREFLERWRFGFLLLVILWALVVEPILFGPRAANWIFDIGYSALLVSALYAVTRRKRGRIWMTVLVAFALSATWIYRLMPPEWYDAAVVFHHLLGAGFLFLMVLVTLKGLFTAEEISFDLLLGTLAGFLMLGTAWAMIFSLVHHISPESFDFSGTLNEFVGATSSRFSVFVYYSFITLTTLGYGDISPVSQTARTLSWMEAAVGQFYIATLVAGIVGIMVSGRAHERTGRQQKASRERGEERPQQ